MASSEQLDFARLLAPVSADNAAGTNLRSGAGRELYDAIRSARAQARTLEKPQERGDPDAPAVPPEEWAKVLDKSQQALAQHSKDLEIATYLIEAMVRLHGFGGLRDGFRLYRELAEKYWENLYPPLDEEGSAARVAFLGGLNGDTSRDGALLFPISRVPLTESSAGSYAAYQYDHAAMLDQLPADRQQERAGNGQVTLKMFEAAAKATPPAFYRQLLEDLEQCQKEFDSLVQLLDTKCGQDAPPSSKIREALAKCHSIVQGMAPIDATPATSAAVGGNGGTDPQQGSYAGAIQSRNEALKRVTAVAKFFRDTEPHSPITYALEQVVRWGNMPLPDLLTELIPDDSARGSLFKLIGIRAEEKNNAQSESGGG